MANPINLGNIGTLNLERLMYIKSFIDKLSDFCRVYKVDTAVIAAYYREDESWERGKGAVNYPGSAPEFPTDGKTAVSCSRAIYITNADLSTPPSRSLTPTSSLKGIQESAKHAVQKMKRRRRH